MTRRNQVNGPDCLDQKAECSILAFEPDLVPNLGYDAELGYSSQMTEWMGDRMIGLNHSGGWWTKYSAGRKHPVILALAGLKHLENLYMQLSEQWKHLGNLQRD